MIDTHTHIDGEEFSEDRDDIIKRAISEGVSTILLPNIDENSLDALKSACEKYEGICLPMYGLHPTEVRENYGQQLDIIFKRAQEDKKSVGIGEIGLDLYWEQDKAQWQADAFTRQIELSIKSGKPMSIHIRNAFPLMYEVFSQFDNKKLVGSLHCFSGTEEDAERCVSEYPNLLFGVNGTFTYKKSPLPEIFKKHIPIYKVLLETDAPYLSPVPMRGKKNEPAYMKYVLDKIADTYGVSKEEAEAKTDDNAKKLFKL